MTNLLKYRCFVVFFFFYLPPEWWHRPSGVPLRSQQRCAPSGRSGSGCCGPDAPACSGWRRRRWFPSAAWGCHRSPRLRVRKNIPSSLNGRHLLAGSASGDWWGSLLAEIFSLGLILSKMSKKLDRMSQPRPHVPHSLQKEDSYFDGTAAGNPEGFRWGVREESSGGSSQTRRGCPGSGTQEDQELVATQTHQVNCGLRVWIDKTIFQVC